MTVLDRREIEFDSDALVFAISASPRAAQDVGLSAMPPCGVRFRPRDGQVEVIYDSTQSPQAVVVDATALGALLAAYCIRARIPMPRRADKSVRIEADSVILAFRMVFKKVPETELPDTRHGWPHRSARADGLSRKR